MALSRTRTQTVRGTGLGEKEEGAETENDDKTREGERRQKKGRWILQPSVETHEGMTQCSSSSSFPRGEFSFSL